MAISVALSPSISVGNPSRRISHRFSAVQSPSSGSNSPIVPRRSPGHLLCTITDCSRIASITSASHSSMCSKALPTDSPEGDSLHKSENIKKEIEGNKVEHKDEWKHLRVQEQFRLIMCILEKSCKEFLTKGILIPEKVSRSLNNQSEDKTMLDILQSFWQVIILEGMEYTNSTENCPDSLRDIMETISSLPPKLTDLPTLDDVDIGILYGVLLSVGGFTTFMFTGSISAVRFGIILGSALLYMAISSLRAKKVGKSLPLLLRGQLAIVAIIFLREWCLLFKKPSITAFSAAVISGIVLFFYARRLNIQ